MIGGNRTNERVDRRLPVELLLSTGPAAAETRNVSVGGMFLVTDARVAFAAMIKIRFRLPALSSETEANVVVRWKQVDGIGVQFVDLRAIEVWGLHQLLRSRP